jgi:hypothetical protein
MLNKISLKFIAQERQGRLSADFSELGMYCLADFFSENSQ